MNSLTPSQTKPLHKQRIACLSKCMTWSLSITLKTFRTTLSYQYLPKGLFVQKNLNEASHELNEADSALSVLPKGLFPPSTPEQLKYDRSTLQHLALPIDNKPTFYQYESRLSLLANEAEDHFSLVMPIELDNSSSPKEQLKLLRDINNSFLSREIFCNLNATIHNQKLLAKDIQFIIEPKRLVKSIQFRIEKHKNWIMRNMGCDKQLNGKRTFFTMLIDNQSIGFEFVKKIENFETLPTNFNSIVNGGVTLTRLFLLIPIPKALLCSKTALCREPKLSDVTSHGTPVSSPNECHSQQSRAGKSSSSSKLSLQKFFSPKSIKSSYAYASITPEQANAAKNKFNTFNFADYTEMIMSSPMKDPSLTDSTSSNTYHYHLTDLSDPLYLKTSPSRETKPKHINDVTKAKIASLLKEHPQTCNYLLFSRQCSLSVKASRKDYLGMKLLSFFNAFIKISLFGLDVNYVIIDNNSIGDLQSVTYFPTLSSMTLNITEPEVIEPILKEISNRKIRQSLSDKTPSVKSMTEDLDNENKTNCSEAYSEYIISEGLKVIVGQDSLRIEYSEVKPPFARSIFSRQIAKCLSSLKAFELIDIDKVVSNSWFCVSWNPHGINKDLRLQKTIFLAYYQFKLPTEDSSAFEPVHIPPIGLLPIKYDEQHWLRPISDGTGAREYDHLITRAMTNVEEHVYLNTNQTSIDYDFYLKTMMAKQHSIAQQNQMLSSLAD